MLYVLLYSTDTYKVFLVFFLGMAEWSQMPNRISRIELTVSNIQYFNINLF